MRGGGGGGTCIGSGLSGSVGLGACPCPTILRQRGSRKWSWLLIWCCVILFVSIILVKIRTLSVNFITLIKINVEILHLSYKKIQHYFFRGQIHRILNFVDLDLLC